MPTVVGIFGTWSDAAKAIERLKKRGIPENRINVLTPATSDEKLESIPTVEAEQPGTAEAIGGVVGGALGAAGGMGLGAAAATFLLPGIGPVLAIGILGAALLGAGGAVGGAAIGQALEEGMAEGLPIDELFVYEDALNKGRTVLVILAEDESEAEVVRQSFEQSEAEGIDSARESWWVGLRDAEEEEYTVQGRDFSKDEQTYRSGFEAAQHPSTRGKTYQEAINFLMAQYPGIYSEEPFRHGYRRGAAYREGLNNNAPRDRSNAEGKSTSKASSKR